MQNLISFITKTDGSEESDIVLTKISPKLNLDEEKYRIISIIGKARMGKSTLLNCIISYLSDDNRYIFNTSDLGEHCTHGITYFIYKNYIFLDCEGIQKDDSINDVKLLLFSYLLSDIIIFNETSDFSNSSIQSLLPLTAFSNFINLEEIKKKPNLIIRISNYDLKTDINETIHKTLNIKRKDNYQSIRNTILQLFNNINGISTTSLARDEQRDLKNKMFLNMMNEENKFLTSIETIIKITNEESPSRSGSGSGRDGGSGCHSIKGFFTKTNNIIEQLKENKINILDLDINFIIQERTINDIY